MKVAVALNRCMTSAHSTLVQPFAGLPLVVCNKKRGRPAQPLPAAVQQHWSEKNGVQPPASGRDSKQQAYFNLDCGQCTTKIQIKTACKKWETCFECIVHGNKGRGLSAPQLAAMREVQQLPEVGSITLEQYRVLSIQQHAIDMVLEQHCILLEVDGKQHEQDASAYSEAAGAQFERDRQLDLGVLRSGGRLVRLNYKDEASWAKHVQAAIRRVQQQPNCSFMYYSTSYPDSWRVKPTDV